MVLMGSAGLGHRSISTAVSPSCTAGRVIGTDASNPFFVADVAQYGAFARFDGEGNRPRLAHLWFSAAEWLILFRNWTVGVSLG